MFVGQDAAAVTLVEPFAQNSASPAALTMAGWALHRAARPTGRGTAAEPAPSGDAEQSARGIAMLETSSRMDPGNLWTHYYLGYAYRDVGRLQEAAAAFQRVLDRVPAHADARRQIRALREQLGDSAPAEREERQPPASRRSSIKIR